MRAIPGGSAVTIRVVGTAGSVLETIETAGHTVETTVPAAVEDGNPSIVVTVGEAALLAVARERPDAPILPVDTAIGPPADDRGAILAAIDGGTERTRSLIDVSIDGERVATALLDVMLVTSEPARISEYAIDREDGRVAAFRADGVVVATPAGSRGYAAAAGGPTLSAGTDTLCAVPIAPFHTQSGQWVLDTGPLALSVLRDEGDVSLLVDDSEYGGVGPDQRIRLTVERSVRTLHP
ncbi:bifunctional NADP phosphatase/NAD kinase [Halalkalicoccus paucihalophilus]|uniref:Bifunctional NADP phosphatase/NAD kinase n=1 Tax=Halalkalicoccus paucihalophilus TaxID=1008153 RepID=A0A151ADH6_9EURY|nr:NAD(+)/NADH kinase [Halalkalicoccus paucihalophilus]KYH25705.1 bifunctional NADP phosphatase/NAD kinase [Halalkalicoccus paucihalophilus]